MTASITDNARLRWQVASRMLAAAVGGYALTSAATVLLALIWPLPPAQAVAASTMLSFALYAGIIVWIFAAKRLQVVWLALLTGTAFCAGLSWWLLPASAAAVS